MVTRISREVRRDGLTADIKASIDSAIGHYRGERFAFNGSSAEATLTASAVSMALPPGGIDIERMEFSASSGSPSRYEMTDRDRYDYDTVRTSAMNAGTNTGQPSRFAVHDDEVHFNYPVADNYAVSFKYLQSFEDVSASATDGASNAWMSAGERMVRSKAKQFLYEDVINNIKRAGLFETISERERMKLKKEIPTAGRIIPTRF